MPLKTINTEWDEYFAACYPDGAPQTQCLECERAFYAGAFVALNLINAMSELPGAEGHAQLNLLHERIVTRMAELADLHFARHQSKRSHRSGGGQ